MSLLDPDGARRASELLDRLEPAIDDCRRIIRAMTPRMRQKPNGTAKAEPVTDVDLAVEQLLVERVHVLAPEAAVISEESHRDTSDLGDGLCVVIDPIDGTKELIRGSPHFGVSVAVLIDGHPAAGLLDFPSTSVRIRSRTDRSVTVGAKLLVSSGSPNAIKRPANELSIAVSMAQLGRIRASRSAALLGRPTAIGAFTPKIAALLLGESSAAMRLPQASDELRIWDYVAAGYLLELQEMVLVSLDGSYIMEDLPIKHLNGWVAGPPEVCGRLVQAFRDGDFAPHD